MRMKTGVKELGKKLLRPIWAPVRARIEQRIEPVEAAIDDLSGRLSAAELETNHVDRRLTALENGWRQHVPGLLNAISSVAAFGYELAALQREMQTTAEESREAIVSLRREFEMRDSDGRGAAARINAEIGNLWKSAEQATRGIGDLWQRVEFIRREIMYESKYGLTNKSTMEKSARILVPEKVGKALATGIRLNLGCGHIPLDGYINVDQRELPGVDIISDVSNLPFEENSVTEIFSAHVLEHFPQERLRRLLPYWRSLLKPQGTFRAIVPDGEAMLSGVAAGTYPFEQFREVLFGAQEYEGDFHFNLFTPDSLSNLLFEAGFKEVTVPIKGRPNGDCFEFEIRGLPG